MGLVGHGLRERQVRGPPDACGEAAVQVLRVRRYRCRSCGVTLTVVPRGVAARRHFGAGAIGLGLLLWSVEHQSARVVREIVGGISAPEQGDWPALRGWIEAISQGWLFGVVRAAPADFSRRQRAERAAMTLVALSPPALEHAGLAAQVFAGAAVAAAAA